MSGKTGAVDAASSCKPCAKNDKLWLVVFIPGASFFAMDCEVTDREEKIDAYLSVPPLNQTRWIQCKGYKCLGVLDPSGKWRCFATGRELIDIVKIHCD
jgi:hypothetical protein